MVYREALKLIIFPEYLLDGSQRRANITGFYRMIDFILSNHVPNHF